MQSILGRLVIAFFPLGLTPLWMFLIAEDYLRFGGGDKDVLLLLPWLLWSLLYLIYFIYGWVRQNTVKQCLLRAVLGATLTFGVMWAALFIWLVTKPGSP